MLANELAKALQIPLRQATISKFADGETNVEIKTTAVRNNIAVILQTTCQPVNDHLIELLLLADALKNARARKIIAIIPYLGYMRQDYLHKNGAALSSYVIANMLNHSGIDHLITLDAHSQQITKMFTLPIINIPSTNVFAADIRARSWHNPIFVAPDLGAINRATAMAKIFNTDVTLIIKKRLATQNIQMRHLSNSVTNRDCIIIDDVIDTGNTIEKAASCLIQKGARQIYVYATHAVLSNNAKQNLLGSACNEIIVSNSIPQKISCDKIRYVSLAELLVAQLHTIA